MRDTNSGQKKDCDEPEASPKSCLRIINIPALANESARVYLLSGDIDEEILSRTKMTLCQDATSATSSWSPLMTFLILPNGRLHCGGAGMSELSTTDPSKTLLTWANSINSQLIPISLWDLGPPPLTVTCDIVSAAISWLMVDTERDTKIMFVCPHVGRADGMSLIASEGIASLLLILTALYLSLCALLGDRVTSEAALENVKNMLGANSACYKDGGTHDEISRARSVGTELYRPSGLISGGLSHWDHLYLPHLNMLHRAIYLPPKPNTGNRSCPMSVPHQMQHMIALKPVPWRVVKVLVSSAPVLNGTHAGDDLEEGKANRITKSYFYRPTFANEMLPGVPALIKKPDKQFKAVAVKKRQDAILHACVAHKAFNCNEMWQCPPLSLDCSCPTIDSLPLSLEVYHCQSGAYDGVAGSESGYQNQFQNNVGSAFHALTSFGFALGNSETDMRLQLGDTECRLLADSRDFEYVKRVAHSNVDTDHPERKRMFIEFAFEGKHEKRGVAVWGDVLIVLRWSVPVPALPRDTPAEEKAQFNMKLFSACSGKGFKTNMKTIEQDAAASLTGSTSSRHERRPSMANEIAGAIGKRVGDLTKSLPTFRKSKAKSARIDNSPLQTKRGGRTSFIASPRTEEPCHGGSCPQLGTEYCIIPFNTTWLSASRDDTNDACIECPVGSESSKKVMFRREEMLLSPFLKETLPNDFTVTLTMDVNEFETANESGAVPSKDSVQPKPFGQHNRGKTNFWKMTKEITTVGENALQNVVDMIPLTVRGGTAVPKLRRKSGIMPVDRSTLEDPFTSELLPQGCLRRNDDTKTSLYLNNDIAYLPNFTNEEHRQSWVNSGLQSLAKLHPILPDAEQAGNLEACLYSIEDIDLALKVTNNNHWSALQYLCQLADWRRQTPDAGQDLPPIFDQMAKEFDMPDIIATFDDGGRLSRSMSSDEFDLPLGGIRTKGQLYYWHGKYVPVSRGEGKGTPPGPPPRWRVTQDTMGPLAPHPLGGGRAPGSAPPSKTAYDRLVMRDTDDKSIAPLGKRLYWKPLRDQSNTIFNQIANLDKDLDDLLGASGDVDTEGMLDVSHLQDVFVKTEKPSSSRMTERTVRGDPKSDTCDKNDRVAIFDVMRCQNINITLARLPSPLVLKRYLSILWHAPYGPEKADIWHRFHGLLLTETEIKAYERPLEGTQYLRAEPELKLQCLATREPWRRRVDLLKARWDLPATLRRIQLTTDAVFAGTQEIKESAKFKQTLSVILRWGNFINHGTVKSSERKIRGFTLESLIKLVDFRSPNDLSITSLHYLAVQMLSPPLVSLRLDQLYDDLPNVVRCIRVSSGSVEMDLETLSGLIALLKDAQQEVESIPSSFARCEFTDTERSQLASTIQWLPCVRKEEGSSLTVGIDDHGTYSKPSMTSSCSKRSSSDSNCEASPNKNIDMTCDSESSCNGTRLYEHDRRDEDSSASSSTTEDCSSPVPIVGDEPKDQEGRSLIEAHQNEWRVWIEDNIQLMETLRTKLLAIPDEVQTTAKFFGSEEATKKDFKLEQFFTTLVEFLDKFHAALKSCKENPIKYAELVNDEKSREAFLDQWLSSRQVRQHSSKKTTAEPAPAPIKMISAQDLKKRLVLNKNRNLPTTKVSSEGADTIQGQDNTQLSEQTADDIPKSDVVPPTDSLQTADVVPPTDSLQSSDVVPPTDSLQTADVVPPTDSLQSSDTVPRTLPKTEPVPRKLVRFTASEVRDEESQPNRNPLKFNPTIPSSGHSRRHTRTVSMAARRVHTKQTVEFDDSSLLAATPQNLLKSRRFGIRDTPAVEGPIDAEEA